MLPFYLALDLGFGIAVEVLFDASADREVLIGFVLDFERYTFEPGREV